MPTDTVLAEVAEAEAAGLQPEDLANLRGAVEGASALGMGMSYTVPDADKAAWVSAWRLEVDYEGLERGKPVPLPKDRLGYYLSKKREVDGGRLFTMKMPERLQGERKFQCFIVPNVCAHKSDTKSNLIDHMENAHPRESVSFKKHIDEIRDAAMSENTALQSIVAGIVNTPDHGPTLVSIETRQAYDETVADVPIVEEPVASINLTVRCEMCGWPEGVEKWAGRTPNQNVLRMHVLARHKNEV